MLLYAQQEFESMFHLRPVAAENEDFLYRAYPKDWTVARKPKLGPPKARLDAEKKTAALHTATAGRRIQSVVLCFFVLELNTFVLCKRDMLCTVRAIRRCERAAVTRTDIFWVWFLAIV